MSIETKTINGIRCVKCPGTNEFLPDMIAENGMTMILDEDNFRYYVLAFREMKPEEITQQMREEAIAQIRQSEAPEKHGLTKAGYSLLPPEERENYYLTAENLWREKEVQIPHGKHITLYRNYIQKYKPEQYKEMMKNRTLNSHLLNLNSQIQTLIETITDQLKEKSPEFQKAQDTGDYLTMTQLLNSFIKSAEEMALKQLMQ